MLVIIDADPSSKFFSSGMWGERLVELKPNVSFYALSALGFERKMLSIAGFFTNISVLSMNVFTYCFSLHTGMFFVEYPKLIRSGLYYIDSFEARNSNSNDAPLLHPWLS